jgi:ribonuclease Z
LDHILGLGGLLSTFSRWETITELEIYGGRSALARIHDLLFGVVLRGAQPALEIRLIEITPGVIFSHTDFEVTAFPVHHRGPDSFGYLFGVRPRRPFLPENAEALNIPPGPWRKELVNGCEVSLPDGSRVHPEQVLGPEKPGTRLVIVGDAGRTDNLYDVCQDADTLVIEATYLQDDLDMARNFSHLTAMQAAEFALEVNVKNLILTHISRRYRERDVLNEARAVFPNTEIARDFDTYQIKRGSLVKLGEATRQNPAGPVFTQIE